MMPDPPEIFARIYARHGHRCPMSTLGGRLGLAALRSLGEAPAALRGLFSNRTCALDGIAETTGLSEEAGTLDVRNDGRHALLLTVRGRSVEVELSEQALELAGRYRSLCNRLEQGWDALAAEEQQRRRTEMEAMLDEILPQFWHMADDDLVRKVDKNHDHF